MDNQKTNNQEKVFEIDTARLEEIRAQARERAKQAKHEWKQKGSNVICESCEYPHGITIGTDKIMIGIENNMPKFVDRDSYMQQLRNIKF